MTNPVYARQDVEAKQVVEDWGSLRWLANGSVGNVQGLTLGRVVIKKGKSNPRHAHPGAEEVLYLLSGQLRHTIGDQSVMLNPGDTVAIPDGVFHNAYSIGDEDADMIVAYSTGRRSFVLEDKASAVHESGGGFTIHDLTISPCCNQNMELEPVLAEYAKIGFKNFEVFTTWAKSAVDINRDPAEYLQLAAKYGMRFTSFHLPAIADDFDASLERAISAMKFAKALGCEVAIYKGNSRDLMIRGAKPFLDATESLGVTPVLQNHVGTPITTLDDYAAVIKGINDSRMKSLLEVGMFHAVGTSWKQGYDLLGDSIALVHIKDMVGAQPVPFGTGEVDLPGLLKHLRAVHYGGRIVIEMDKRPDPENTLRYLTDSINYFRDTCGVSIP
ncbi:MAG TPA: TIM barrel protein [Tepidisphaeraceae bacterium]|jgi:sugar phosphate isomerase/epimerase/quercetin dioxygenase-like cupin family protein|nr:TIM barrel protein [Tepidisphaeraceae bacterium]